MTLRAKTVWFAILMASLALLAANAAKLPPMPPGTRLSSPKGAEALGSLGKRMAAPSPQAMVLPRGRIEISWDNGLPEDRLEASTDLVSWSIVEGAGNPATLPTDKPFEVFRVHRPK